jgi:hypothetical protein
MRLGPFVIDLTLQRSYNYNRLETQAQKVPADRIPAHQLGIIGRAASAKSMCRASALDPFEILGGRMSHQTADLIRMEP